MKKYMFTAHQAIQDALH